LKLQLLHAHMCQPCTCPPPPFCPPRCKKGMPTPALLSTYKVQPPIKDSKAPPPPPDAAKLATLTSLAGGALGPAAGAAALRAAVHQEMSPGCAQDMALGVQHAAPALAAQLLTALYCIALEPLLIVTLTSHSAPCLPLSQTSWASCSRIGTRASCPM
jgi:hypothetical protein